MKKLILFFCFIFFSFLSYAQQIQFEISGKVNNTISSYYTTTREYTSNRLTKIIDSLYQREYYKYISSTKKTYDSNIGFDVSGKVSFHISDRLSLKTGWTINYHAFEMMREGVTLTNNQEFIKRDTIVFTPSTPVGGTHCTYENSIEDVGGINNAIKTEIISLAIPLGFQYEILPDVLIVEFGGFLQTPVYSEIQSERITVKRTQTPSGDVCRYEKIILKDKYNDVHNNLRYGIMANIGFRVIDNIYLEAGIKQDLSNLYFQKDEVATYFFNDSYKPLTVSAGVTYKFSRETPDLKDL